MRLKGLATVALTMALSVSGAFTSMAGWVGTPQGMKYQWGSGDYCTNNWVQYKNHWYFFGNDQILRTGWIHIGNDWYFASDTGELQAGLLKINGNTYYMNTTTCKLFTGDFAVDDKMYHFTENGTTNGQPYIYQEWNSNGTVKRGTKFKIR